MMRLGPSALTILSGALAQLANEPLPLRLHAPLTRNSHAPRLNRRPVHKTDSLGVIPEEDLSNLDDLPGWNAVRARCGAMFLPALLKRPLVRRRAR